MLLSDVAQHSTVVVAAAVRVLGCSGLAVIGFNPCLKVKNIINGTVRSGDYRVNILNRQRVGAYCSQMRHGGLFLKIVGKK